MGPVLEDSGTPGRVVPKNLARPFGYITPSDGSKDVNVRSSDIQRNGGYKALSEGQEVEFEVSVGHRVRKPRTSEC